MYKYSFTLTLFLATLFLQLKAVNITIQGNTSSSNIPMGNANYHVSEYIYRFSEFGNTGNTPTFNVDYIGFNLNSLSTSGLYNNVRILYSLTTDSAFTSSTPYSESGFIQIYNGPINFTTSGWKTVNLMFPYSYPYPNTPGYNLFIRVERYNSNPNSGNTFLGANGFTGANGLYSAREYNANVAPQPGISMLNLSTERPAIRFGGYPFTRLNIRAFMQTYYMGNLQMPNVLSNLTPMPSYIFDGVVVDLQDKYPPHDLIYSQVALMDTAGFVSINLPYSLYGGNYYIRLKHRNSISVCSANPVSMDDTLTNYYFNTAASQAYANNQVQIDPGVFALYSGDIESDEIIDIFDYIALDADLQNGAFGYLNTDLNGDGSVDLWDYLSLVGTNNIAYGISSICP